MTRVSKWVEGFWYGRFVNLALLADTLALLATGILLLQTNRAQDAWLYTLHRYSGAILPGLLIPKTRVIWRSLARRVSLPGGLDPTTWVGVALSGLLLLVLALALAWTLDLLPFYLRVILSITPLELHWYLAFALVPFLAWHAYRRWPLPRRRETARSVPPSLPAVSRRTMLSLLMAGGIGLAGWAGLEVWAGATPWTRRFTGSRLVSDSGGNDFPVTQTDAPPSIDLAAWRLRVTGRVREPLELSYADLLALPSQTHSATVDCTLGWAATREWRGVPLAVLLERAGIPGDARQVRCSAVTGYHTVLGLEEAQGALVATHVGGEALAPAHGFPARLVAPDERGFRWCKWLSELQVS